MAVPTFICLECPYCPKKYPARGRGVHYVEIKTAGTDIYLSAVCCTCKHVQLIKVDVPAKNCGRVIHCGSNNRHKVYLTTKKVIVRCHCDKQFFFPLKKKESIV